MIASLSLPTRPFKSPSQCACSEKGDRPEGREKRELTKKKEDVVENEPPLLVVDADLVKLP